MRKRTPIYEMDKITDNLWLGSYSVLQNLEILHQENITKILTIMENPLETLNEDGFDIKFIKAADNANENLYQYFVECINFLSGNENVLVHCLMGMSRSATIVIAYIMWKNKMSFEEALNFVQSKRENILPNSGFRKQLKFFDKKLKEFNYDLNKIENIQTQNKPKLMHHKSLNGFTNNFNNNIHKYFDNNLRDDNSNNYSNKHNHNHKDYSNNHYNYEKSKNYNNFNFIVDKYSRKIKRKEN